MKNFLLIYALVFIGRGVPGICFENFENGSTVNSREAPTQGLLLHGLNIDGISLSDAAPTDLYYISAAALLEAESSAKNGYTVSMEMTTSPGKIGSPFVFKEASDAALIEFSLAVDQKSIGWQPSSPKTTYLQGENIISFLSLNPEPQRKQLHFVAEKSRMTTPGTYSADLTAVLTDNR